ILNSWKKKQAVALHKGFYDTLPELDEVNPDEADLAWFVYDLVYEPNTHQYQLTLHRIAYTMFSSVLTQIATPQPGSINAFVEVLQEKLDAKFDSDANPPDAPILTDLL
ncbi:MAG: hypothetical protein D6737_16020, partial [Chloroflexi bacterium]